ncbi:hypothetical protein M0R01_01120 [bacterium]|nr:hypothetical protein [bacterium]
MEIEEMFQKINKTSYELENHKESLRAALMQNKYFTQNDLRWNFSLAIPSLSFAFIVIIFTGTYISQPIVLEKKDDFQSTLYGRLSKNNNVLRSDYGSIKELQIKQENVKTSLYFNKKNVLIRSETKK